MANQKHLNLKSRYFIEKALDDGLSFKAIAAELDKDPTTISKEIRNHKVLKRPASSVNPSMTVHTVKTVLLPRSALFVPDPKTITVVSAVNVSLSALCMKRKCVRNSRSLPMSATDVNNAGSVPSKRLSTKLTILRRISADPV